MLFLKCPLQYTDHFKPKRSCGPDDIPLIVLKDSLQVMAYYIKKLFNKLALGDKIPSTWKYAKIKPIFKKGDPKLVENYRPISNLNSISKLFERCVLNRLPSDAKTDGVNQHGFKTGHSTVTAGLDIQSHLAIMSDRGEKSIIYSVDLSAAFDVIRPAMFYKKMVNKMDIPTLNCLNYFLTNRKAQVEVDGHSSVFFSFKAGCPQGSTLGPKIFNMYCSDLSSALKHGYVVSYADDTYVIVSDKDEKNLLKKANSTIKDHAGWLKWHDLQHCKNRSNVHW